MIYAIEYWNGSSTEHSMLTYLACSPKYRSRVLHVKAAIPIKTLFKQCCEINDWEIHELGISEDHVRMLIRTHPRESRSRSVLKGDSSKVIRAEYPELEEFLWGDSFWSDGYFAESIGSKNEKVIRKYIKNQAGKDKS